MFATWQTCLRVGPNSRLFVRNPNDVVGRSQLRFAGHVACECDKSKIMMTSVKKVCITNGCDLIREIVTSNRDYDYVYYKWNDAIFGHGKVQFWSNVKLQNWFGTCLCLTGCLVSKSGREKGGQGLFRPQFWQFLPPTWNFLLSNDSNVSGHPCH